jgi:mannose-6-phosphate isomerase-like protein (cupin superfamily)
MKMRTDVPAITGIVVPPGRGRTFGSADAPLELKVAPEAGGQFGVMEGVLPPGAGPAPHRHQRYDEAFYVLEGEIDYRIGDEWITASAGTCVFAPAGLTHGFRNGGVTNARQLVIAAPAEALELVEALHRVPADEVDELLRRYSTEFLRAQ